MLTKAMQWLLERRELWTEMIVVVPTAQSARRLREQIAYARAGLAPMVVTPQFLLPQRDAGVAAGELAAWTEVLLELDLDDARDLFPKDPPEGVANSFRWAFNIAKQLVELSKQVSGEGLSFRDIQNRSPEQGRWSDISKLEYRVKKKLEYWQIKNEEAVEVAEQKRIVIAGVCDLSPAAVRFLTEKLQRGEIVEQLIHAPFETAETFSEWGQPLASFWEETTLLLPDWREKVSLAEHADLAAKEAVQSIAENKWLPEEVAVGLCDREMVRATQREFQDAGWKTFDPDGTSVQSSSFVQFVRALKSWLRENRPVDALMELLRLPESEFLLGEGVDRYSLVADLDVIKTKRLPESVNDLLGYLQASEGERNRKLEDAVRSIVEQTDALNKGSAVRGLKGWLARALNRTQPDVAGVVVDAVAQMLGELEKVGRKSKRFSIGNLLEMITECLSVQKVSVGTEDTVLDLQGWMELIYDDAPHLLLLGLHEGVVPQQGGDDPFLPESLRENMEMTSGQQRYARDSYLFRSLVESREDVRIFLTKVNDAGEPKSPSRLLLRTTGTDLAERVQTFFGEAEVQPENPSAWQRDWMLEAPSVHNPYAKDNEEMRFLSPSALKDYLACPFRFFLRRVVRMERYEARKAEMSALDFGNLVHAVVEHFGRDEGLRGSYSVNEIREGFDALLDDESGRRFGRKPNLALEMQREIARARLHALAYHQAEQRAEGWKIVEVELDVGKELPWEIAGHPIRMQVDRIERNEGTGKYRVMDYKTSAKAKSPQDAHLTSFKAEENRPILGELITPPRKRSECRWQNLQLPIYAWFVKEHYGLEEIPEVGYIQMPSATSDTEFAIWKTFDDTLLTSAQQWAEEAVRRIENSEFFSAAELSVNDQKWDDFAKLAQGSLKDAFSLK